MRHRIVRLIVVVMLLAVGAGAAVFAWTVESNERVAAAAQRDVDRRVDLLAATVADISAAQTAYVAPGQDPNPSLERFPLLLSQVSTGTAEIGPMLRAANGPHTLQSFADATSSLAQADAMARDSLLLGDVLTASHVIFGEARAAIAAMTVGLGTLRAAESSARARERASAMSRAWMTVGGAGLLWTIGLLALAPLSSHRRPALDARPPADEDAVVPEDAMVSESPTSDALGAADMIEAADLCTAISRVDTATALTGLLARAATLLDGAGIIVWIGAGEELFAATAHGYSAATMSRLGAIPRDSGNATAAAWRTGDLQVVPGGATSHGAIAAPLFGLGGCIGVFAVELRHGREADAMTRAISAMIAAQLATVVAGWPGASPAAFDVAETTEPEPARPSEL